MLGQCAQSVPLEATLYGGGGGGRAKFGKKSRFYYRTEGDNENKANFQGVPYTFDQDCSSGEAGPRRQGQLIFHDIFSSGILVVSYFKAFAYFVRFYGFAIDLFAN